MTAHRDTAVSTVVGAILVLALITGALILYQLTIVPDLKEDAEVRHMETVGRDMGALTTELLRELGRGSGGPLSSSVALSAETPAFVPTPSQTGTLSFEPKQETMQIGSPSLKVVERNGTPLVTASGQQADWNAIQDGETVADVEEVVAMRLNLTDGTPQDGDSLLLEAQDASGAFAGDFQASTTVGADDLALILRTRAPPSPGTVIFHNHQLDIANSRWDDGYWIDPMDDLYSFDQLLEDAAGPLDLVFRTGGLDAAYVLTYREQITDEVSMVRGPGSTLTDYSKTYETGLLTYEAENEFFVDQTYAVEHGALLRRQTEGAVFLVGPPFSVKAGGGVVNLDLSVPSLKGISDTASGTGEAILRMQGTSEEALAASAGELDITWGTDSPALWSSWLEDELTDAGLTSSECPPQSADSPCQFEITTTSNTVKLDMHGPTATDADPSNPTRDIFLNLQRGRIDTEVQT